jgi:uncharacterized protein (UPF0548 family)
MFTLRRPSTEQIAAFLEAQSRSSLSYRHGQLSGAAPAGFDRDHLRARIGRGERTFSLARRALADWTMFDLGWVSLHPRSAPIRVGTNVAVLGRHVGFFSLNGCRVVDHRDESHRFAFRYGTLLDHAECGEETFAVEMDARGDVYYEIRATSRPQALAARWATRWRDGSSTAFDATP